MPFSSYSLFIFLERFPKSINVFSHILLCNLLTTLLRPNFEEPLDTAKQLVKKNITLYDAPGAEMWKQFLLESSIPEYNILGETFIIADDWDHLDILMEHDVIGAGTHAYIAGSVAPYYLDMGKKHHPEGNGIYGWYRSKEKVAGDNPYVGYLTNKKWHLNEVFSLKQFVYSLLLI